MQKQTYCYWPPHNQVNKARKHHIPNQEKWTCCQVRKVWFTGKLTCVLWLISMNTCRSMQLLSLQTRQSGIIVYAKYLVAHSRIPPTIIPHQGPFHVYLNIIEDHTMLSRSFMCLCSNLFWGRSFNLSQSQNHKQHWFTWNRRWADYTVCAASCCGRCAYRHFEGFVNKQESYGLIF